MKKRRSAIVAFLLVAILCLGIGFAALTDDLLVDAKVGWDQTKSQDDFKLHVFFTKVTEASVSGDTLVESDTGIAGQVSGGNYITGANTNGVTFSIGNQVTGTGESAVTEENDLLSVVVPAGILGTPGQTLTFKAFVKNNSTDSIQVTVAEDTTTSTGTNGMKVSMSSSSNPTITAGEVGEVEITIKLDTAPNADVDASAGDTATFHFVLNASAVNVAP